MEIHEKSELGKGKTQLVGLVAELPTSRVFEKQHPSSNVAKKTFVRQKSVKNNGIAVDKKQTINRMITWPLVG